MDRDTYFILKEINKGISIHLSGKVPTCHWSHLGFSISSASLLSSISPFNFIISVFVLPFTPPPSAPPSNRTRRRAPT